ncbi:MAG: transporter substrate-binding domain-containing protein [Spirochaetales bacterium]|nr:transporter substrate-binding domain-containing protein [Spirochaetales bacterium]
MKNVFTLSILFTVLLGIIGCGNGIDNDYKYIKSNGVLRIGITEFPPMNYHDADDNLIGFDTEFAKEVCAELGLEAEFIDINWDLRDKELEKKNIDCIWNGTTLTEREEKLSITQPYIASKEVLIAKQSRIQELEESLDNAVISVEAGSTGELITLFIQDDIHINLADSQLHAIYDVESGAADAAVIDYLMLYGCIGTDSLFKDLVMSERPMSADEVMVVAFRKKSNMTSKVNKIITKMKKNGTLAEIARKYDIEKLLIH